MKEEIIKAKIRVKEMYYADPIESETAAATADFKPLPCTFRGDEVMITTEEPDKEEVFCNEQDAPLNTEYIAKPYKLKGAFLNLSKEHLKELVGFKIDTKGVSYSGNLHHLEKAIKIVTFADKEIILPRVDGFVRVDLGLGAAAVSKAPFEFALKQASGSWDRIMYFPEKGGDIGG